MQLGKTLTVYLVIALAFTFLFSGLNWAQSATEEPEWAFPVTSANQPPREDGSVVKTLPGSSRTYTVEQIDDLFNPPDWFPDQHPPAPRIVMKGDERKAPACGSCHLMSGHGHPQSANLAGLPEGYLETQLRYFKQGDRQDPFQMTAIGKALSDADIRLASEWFAALKPKDWEQVKEIDTVPKTYVKKPHMRLPLPSGGSEPIGDRIIELPQNPERAVSRDPNSGFIAYVPIGSVSRGQNLVKTGGAGKTIPCAICHGETLNGLGDVPRIAGVSPEYLGRQLYRFQDGTRNGKADALMKAVVEHLERKDIVDISAYVASLSPVQPKSSGPAR